MLKKLVLATGASIFLLSGIAVATYTPQIEKKSSLQKAAPTVSPTMMPSPNPTGSPSPEPTTMPNPTESPSPAPTVSPSVSPTPLS